MNSTVRNSSRAIWTFPGVVVGVLLFYAYAKMIEPAVHFGWADLQRGEIHEPLQEILDDIKQTYDRGDAQLAERKTRLLHQRWSEFMHGGPVPFRFQYEIGNLAPTTQPVR